MWRKISLLKIGEKEKNEKIKGQTSSRSLILVYMIHLPTTCVPSFNLLGLTVFEKSVTNNFQCWKLERKKNEEIKGWISSSSLILDDTIDLPTVYVCTKFQSSRPHSSREKCDEKVQCWKLERKKWRYEYAAAAWFRHTWYICPLSTRVPSFNLLGFTVPEKSVTKFFSTHETSAHCPSVYKVSIF